MLVPPRDTGPMGRPGSSIDVQADAAAAAQHPADAAAASLPSDSRFIRTATPGTGCVTPASDSATGAELQTTSETDVAPWGQWDSFADAENAVPACSAPLTPSCAPPMPCQPDDSAHRHKLNQRSQPFNACVARPVNKTEIASAPAAQQAMKVEWGRLRAKRVWDETIVREWDDVANEARQAGVEANLGYLFGLCTEKNSEQPKGHPSHKYKGRVVFQGSRVV